MRSRLTIKDTTRSGGVEKSTASRVLNNESDVGEHTRERAETVMNQHGFSLSHFARAVRGQSNKVAAIIVTHLDSFSENLAVQTMLPAFHEQGYDLIVVESQLSPELVEGHLGMLRRRNIDGVVLLDSVGITEAMFASWQGSLVLLTGDAEGFASICYDDEGTIRTPMQCLYEREHCHTGFLGVLHSDATTGKRRHEVHLVFCKKHKPHPVAMLPGLAMKQGCEQAADIITPETTALVCTTDTLALGVSKYLQKQRIENLQLASAGNAPPMKLLRPEIITVDPGYTEAGRRTASQLIGQINGRNEPRQIVIPSTLS